MNMDLAVSAKFILECLDSNLQRKTHCIESNTEGKTTKLYFEKLEGSCLWRYGQLSVENDIAQLD